VVVALIVPTIALDQLEMLVCRNKKEEEEEEEEEMYISSPTLASLRKHGTLVSFCSSNMSIGENSLLHVSPLSPITMTTVHK
jgi:hypothetical protein